jgi:TolB-like protein/DNA-binding SARP family transcriptional activator
MSVIAELKRRNVFRVGVAYAIVAWLLVEVASVMLPTFKAPEWVMQVFTFLVVLGFPLALILAWAFELTPGGIKRETAVDPAESITHVTGRKIDFAIIGLLVLAVAFMFIDNYVLEAEPAQSPAASEQPSAAEPAPAESPTVRDKSIAVLPFVNMSSDPEQEYFSDGLSEEILNLLAKVPGLKVIARTSSFAFKGKNEDVRSIGKTLGVSTVLEGSVRKSTDRVRVTAQLIDVESGAHLWSETYDRMMTDIFEMQDSVASEILDALQIHVGAAPTRGRPTEDTEAYSLFLKGRAALNRSDGTAAKEFARKAIELDPMFAEAHELLALGFWNSGSSMDAVDAQRGTFDAAAKALAIDPSLLIAQALRISGDVENYSFAREIEALERILREEPNDAGAAIMLTYNLIFNGYFEESLGISEHLVEVDPLSAVAHSSLYNSLRSNGRRSQALASLRLAEQLDSPGAKWTLAMESLVDGRDEIAIQYLETLLREQNQPIDWIQKLIIGARDPATGQAHLDRQISQLMASLPEDRSSQVLIDTMHFYLVFGFLDRYFELIFELGISDREWVDSELPVGWGLIYRQSGFTAHPRFLEVAEAFGMIELWEQRGPPDFCEKVSGQWICE